MKKKEKRLNVKLIISIIFVILIFILIPLAINWIASIPNPYVKGDPESVEATWIGFWGSYLGGFFSALAGAGVSGLVAFFLIYKQVEENRRSETLLIFSTKFNEDFQMIKKDIIQNIAEIHNSLQFYHLGECSDEALRSELDEWLKKALEIQTQLHQIFSVHSLLCQYTTEHNPEFNPNYLCENYTACFLVYNKLMVSFSKTNHKNAENNIVQIYNTEVIDKVNILRQYIVKMEQEYVGELFPVLKTQNSYNIAKVMPITETDYEKFMETHSNNIVN